MNSLNQINAFLDDDFEDRFKLEEFNQEDTKEEAIDYFETYFEDMYNGEIDYVGFGELKEYCNFDKVMKICEFVAEKYEEYDMTINKSHFEDFGDKILKSYIYFYYMENQKQEFITKIQDYYDEEEEPEPELPQAQ